MTPKEQAEKLVSNAYKRWCYELSHEKNVVTAKDIAIYMCKLVTNELDAAGLYTSYWQEVIEEIKKIRI